MPLHLSVSHLHPFHPRHVPPSLPPTQPRGSRCEGQGPHGHVHCGWHPPGPARLGGLPRPLPPRRTCYALLPHPPHRLPRPRPHPRVPHLRPRPPRPPVARRPVQRRGGAEAAHAVDRGQRQRGRPGGGAEAGLDWGRGGEWPRGAAGEDGASPGSRVTPGDGDGGVGGDAGAAETQPQPRVKAVGGGQGCLRCPICTPVAATQQLQRRTSCNQPRISRSRAAIFSFPSLLQPPLPEPFLSRHPARAAPGLPDSAAAPRGLPSYRIPPLSLSPALFRTLGGSPPHRVTGSPLSRRETLACPDPHPASGHATSRSLHSPFPHPAPPCRAARRVSCTEQRPPDTAGGASSPLPFVLSCALFRSTGLSPASRVAPRPLLQAVCHLAPLSTAPGQAAAAPCVCDSVSACASM